MNGLNTDDPTKIGLIFPIWIWTIDKVAWLSNKCFRFYRIRLGEWDVNNDSEFYTHIEFDATDIFVHEEFYPGNLYNDIAMIRLKGYVDFTRNPHVSPICLPDHLEDYAGQRCHVTGWGKDAFNGGAYQHVLKEVELPIHNHR